MMIRRNTNGQLEAEVNSAPSDAGERYKVKQHSRLDLEEFVEQRTMRTVEPTLIVPIGGSALQTASRLKKLLQLQGTDSYTQFMAIDTDETAQTGAAGCPSFGDDEFVHVKMGRVRNVIENPKAHKQIIERIGIDEPEQAAFHERLIHDGICQASQVRSFGSLALLSEFTSVRAALKNAIGKLNGAYSALEKQLESNNRIIVRHRMTIFVLFSNGGGTGSSMALTVMALLRSLTKGLPVEIVAVMIMPSAFDSVMDGKPEQAVRIGANAVATMLELDAARNGFFSQQRIHVGPDDRNEITVPPGLFNQLFVAGRHLADGRDLGSHHAVYDAIALHLAAIIGTEISDRVEAEDANQATLRGLTPDPMTGKSRYVSVMAATALALPVERIAKHCAARQTIEFIDHFVVGVLDEKALHAQIEAWKHQPLESDSITIDERELPTAILRYCLPNPGALIRPLYRVVHGSERLHFRNSVFVQHVSRLQAQFKEVQLPAVEAKLLEIVNSLTEDLKVSLGKKISQLAKSHGWKTVHRFCGDLSAQLLVLANQLGIEAESDLTAARAGAAQIKETMTPLQSFFRAWFVSKKRQNHVASQCQSAILAALGNVVKLASQRMVNSIQAEALSHQQAAERTLAGAERCLKRAQADFADSRAGRRVTTTSLVELDVSTPATDRQLYDSHHLDEVVLLDRLRQTMAVSSSTALRRLVTEPKAFESLMQRLQKYFLGQFASVSVVDVLADQLSNPATAADAQARIKQAVIGCQPMWRAESGQNGVEFADSMLVGLPESQIESKHNLVLATLMESATHRIHANGQYNGNASPVTSGDVHRIYIIRRSHGGCLFYLPDVVKAQADYDQWLRGGGHPVHIFNPQIVMKLPGLIPKEDADEGELEFSLGLAYAWIANRGPHWYWNLEESSSESKKLVCRLTSHWDGLAFQDQARITGGGSLNTFVQSGRLVYEEQAEALPAQKLGQDMEDAFDCVKHNGEMIELIHETFDELRAAVGDVRVADDLERYLANLKKRTRPSDTNFGLTMKMIEHLSYQANALRNGKN